MWINTFNWFWCWTNLFINERISYGEDILSEMIATKPSKHLNKIKQRYPELYNETLENDIKRDTSDYFTNILIPMI